MSYELNEIAASLQDRLATANRKESEAESNLRDAQQEKSEVQASIQRVKLLRSGDRQLAIDDCLECFVLHKRDSKMTAIPSDSNVDIFRCRVCGYEKEIEP